MGRADLTTEEWARLKPHLPKSGQPGGRWGAIAGSSTESCTGSAPGYDKLAVRYEATVLVAAINELL